MDKNIVKTFSVLCISLGLLVSAAITAQGSTNNQVQQPTIEFRT
ncbi:MAG: hypothetical protein ACK5MJ_04560 [Alphaproteobacteria bacterium]